MKNKGKSKTPRVDFYSIRNLLRAYAYVHRSRAKMQNGMSFLTNLERRFIVRHKDDFFRLLSEQLETTYEATAADYYFGPKNGFGLRPMAVLALADAITYQAILNPAVFGKTINARLRNGTVFANRIASRGRRFFHPYKKQWKGFVHAQRRAYKDGYTYRIELDVQNYYQTIDHGVLRHILQSHFEIPDGDEMELLFNLLEKWSEQRLDDDTQTLHRGLPQGYEASDLLANAYLSPIDEFVADKFGASVRFFRYNDDMVLMLKSQQAVNRVIADVSAELLKLGLSVNGKSGCRKVENIEEFDQMTFAPYGEPEFAGIDATLDIEKGIKETFDRLNAGENVEKLVGSKMKYYLRTGGLLSDSYADDAIELLFKRPEFAFHASEYLEWRTVTDKDVFLNIWKKFQKQGPELTDWQLYCVTRLLGIGSENIGKYRRWEKVFELLNENENWPMRILASLIAKENAKVWGKRTIEKLAKAIHEPVALQYTLFLADWSQIDRFSLPRSADHIEGSAWLLAKSLYKGEFMAASDDAPKPEEATLPSAVDDIQLLRETNDGVQELLRRVPQEAGPVLLDYEQVDAFLHVTLGKREPLALPMADQHTHVLHFLLERCELMGTRYIGVTYEEVWDYLFAISKKHGFTDIKEKKPHRSTKKSIDRHIERLEEKIKEAFPGLRKKPIFKLEKKGFTFFR